MGRSPPRMAGALRVLGATTILAASTMAHPFTGIAQEPPSARAVAVLTPDTIRVGEPFTLGVSVAAPPEAGVSFPPLLVLGPELEQLRPPTVSRDDVGGGSRARYRLVAWKAGRWEIPTIALEWDDGRATARPPAVRVLSVLPAAPERPLQLEPPRGPVPRHGFPWWLLFLLLALVLLRWLLRRLRGEPFDVESEHIDPSVAARRAFAALRTELENGDLDLASFYDGIETTLRRYLAATRDWPDERPVRDFVDTVSVPDLHPHLMTDLRSMRDRAGLVRFAHVSTATSAALGDADACLAWVDAEEAA